MNVVKNVVLRSTIIYVIACVVVEYIMNDHCNNIIIVCSVINIVSVMNVIVGFTIMNILETLYKDVLVGIQNYEYCGATITWDENNECEQ